MTEAVVTAEAASGAAFELAALVRGWTKRAQLVVVHRGRTVIEVAVGCEPDDRFWLFSASKPFATVLALQLADEGLISLDAPVADYWPEFARGGKGAITVRQVLAHRTGLPTAGLVVGDVLTMHNPRRLSERIERARPSRRYDPAKGAAYEYLIFGPIIAEIARRTTGLAYRDLVTERILAPLGMTRTRVGLAPGEESIPVRRSGLASPAAGYLNSRRIREAVIPSGGVIAPARELATFYAGLLGDLAGDGPGILRRETLAAAIEPTGDGGMDLFLHRPIAWATGFQLGGERTEPRYAPPFGYASTERTFGHNGSYACMAWADPDRDIVMAVCTDRLPAREVGRKQAAAISDAVFSYVTDLDRDASDRADR